MTTASLGFAIDSSPAAKAASDLDQLVTAAGRTEAATERMSSSVTRAVTRIGGAGAQINTQLGKVANDTENLAKRIERALNVRTSFGGAERGRDIAAFGQELDRLRGKFNPVFNTLTNYRKTLGEIREAHKVGAISADEMAAAISRERQAALASVQALKGRQQAMGGLGGIGGNAAFRRQNLGYQAFDIGQGLAGGINPAMILAQQGPQIAQLYAGAGGAKAALGDVASLATGAVSAIGALPLALGAAGAAAILYAKRNEVSLKSANELLEQHRANIEALGTAYGVAEQRAQAYSAADRAVANAATQGSLEDLNKLQVQSARELRLQFGSMQTPGKGGQAFFAPFPDYKPFADPFRDLDNGIRNGRVEGEKFIDAVSQIAKVNPEYDEFANKILKTAQQFLQINTEVSKTKDLLTQIAALPPLDPLGAFNPQREMDERAARTPSQFQQRQARMDAYRRQTFARSAAEREAAARAAAAAQFDANENPTDRENRIAMAGFEARLQAERQLQDAQRERAANLNRMLSDQQNEIDLVDKTGGAAAALRKEYELTSALRADAARSGEEADQKEIDAIKQKTAEYGKFIDLLNQRRFETDFRRQVGDTRLSERNRQIVTTLRQYGLSEDLNSPNASMIGKQYDFQQAKDLAKGFGDAFSSELISGSHDIGKSFLKGLEAALSNGATKAWEKVFDSLGSAFASWVTGSKGGGAGTAGLSTVASAIVGGAANDNVTGKAPVIPVTRAPLGDIASYITQAAAKRGIDPDIALRVAKSEGGLNSWNLQSNYVKNGVREPSFGPFQLYKGGGLGNKFMAQTGLDPADASAGPAGIDFALDEARKSGWGAWYGAKKAGIGNFEGIGTYSGGDSAVDAVTKLGEASKKTATGLDALGQGAGGLGHTLASIPQALMANGGGSGILSSLTKYGMGLFSGSSQFANAWMKGGIGLYANGTNYAPGGLSVVGERGPELVNLPQGSGVMSNHKLMQSLNDNNNQRSNAPANLNVNVIGANGDEHVRALVRQGVGQALSQYNEQQRRVGFGETQKRFVAQKG
ncbi:phage tail tape measure protein [Sinorhizobium medicae]|nr:phage tail tape measure protein [Sinorhizobium medicae]